MLTFKFVIVFSLGSLAGFGSAWIAWTHQQKAAMVNVQHGGTRMLDTDVARKIQHFPDR
jgi:hypothetical protein